MDGGGPFFLGRGTGAVEGAFCPPEVAGFCGGAGGGLLDMSVAVFLFLTAGVGFLASAILCLFAGGPGELERDNRQTFRQER